MCLRAHGPACVEICRRPNHKLNADHPGTCRQRRYQNKDAFTDVTLGTNAIGRGGQKLPYGFVAQAGWDAATGLGLGGTFDMILTISCAFSQLHPHPTRAVCCVLLSVQCPC